MIEQIFFWILTFLCLAYVFLHLFLWKGITRLLSPKSAGTLQPISVIVAARNEAQNISPLLASLGALDYPIDSFEIIIVNDRSTDATPTMVTTFVQQHPNVRLLTIDSNTSDMPNKKNALRLAITNARFDLLAFTDADCIVPKDWLTEISRHFSDDVGAVAGYSPYASTGSRSFLRYEDNKNSLIAASAVELKNAFLCTGRNFAYRKQVYTDLGGFESIKHSVSGDDDLFLQQIQQRTAWNIRYMTAPGSYVLTKTPTSLSQFFNQRTRHISASKYYPKKIQAFYSVIHLFHLSIAAGFFITPLTALIMMMIKFNMDGAIIAAGKKIFHEEFTVTEFIQNEILLVLYTFFIGPLGLIMKFDWKGTRTV